MSTVTGRFGDKVKKDLGHIQKLRDPVKAIEDFRKISKATLKSSR